MSPEPVEATNVLSILRGTPEGAAIPPTITIVSSSHENVVQFVKFNTVSEADQDRIAQYTLLGSHAYRGHDALLHGHSAVTGEFVRVEEIGGYDYVLFRPYVHGVISDSIYEALICE